MSAYQLPPGVDDDSTGVLRIDPPPTTSIPPDPANADWQHYQDWLGEGNTPEPGDMTGHQRAAFAAAEDQERLKLINERARTDPAYAALAEYVLRGVSR